MVGTAGAAGTRNGAVGRPHGPGFAWRIARTRSAESNPQCWGFSCCRRTPRTASPRPRIANPAASLQSNAIRSPCAQVRSIFEPHNPPCARPPPTTNHTRPAFCVVVHGGSDNVPDDAIHQAGSHMAEPLDTRSATILPRYQRCRSPLSPGPTPVVTRRGLLSSAPKHATLSRPGWQRGFVRLLCPHSACGGPSTACASLRPQEPAVK